MMGGGGFCLTREGVGLLHYIVADVVNSDVRLRSKSDARGSSESVVTPRAVVEAIAGAAAPPTRSSGYSRCPAYQRNVCMLWKGASSTLRVARALRKNEFGGVVLRTAVVVLVFFLS